MSCPKWWADVVEQMDSFQRANPANLPGAVFAAESQRDGPFIGSVGPGWRNDAICSIGSMTKPFIATAVLMALEEHNRLDVETPVYRLPGMEPYAATPAKRLIRVRDLLQHTSGLPVFLSYTDCPSTPCNDPTGSPPCCVEQDLNLGPTVPWIGSPGYTNECVRVNGHCRPARHVSLEHVTRHIMETYPLLHGPGAQYSYSSANYIIGGRIVEALTGQSVNRYLKERLFAPLGMNDSFFVADKTADPEVDARLEEGVTDAQRARIADVSLITRDGLMPPEVAPGADGTWDKFRRGWRFVYPDGGMYSTAHDLLTFLRMLRDSGVIGVRRILSPAVLNLVVNDQGFGRTMAFGYRSQSTPYGQGPGTLEHLGNIMTYFWSDPRPGNTLLAVFLSQRLPNAVVNNNVTEGMRVIFRVFVPFTSLAGNG